MKSVTVPLNSQKSKAFKVTVNVEFWGNLILQITAFREISQNLIAGEINLVFLYYANYVCSLQAVGVVWWLGLHNVWQGAQHQITTRFM